MPALPFLFLYIHSLHSKGVMFLGSRTDGNCGLSHMVNISFWPLRPMSQLAVVLLVMGLVACYLQGSFGRPWLHFGSDLNGAGLTLLNEIASFSLNMSVIVFVSKKHHDLNKSTFILFERQVDQWIDG